MTPLLRLMDEPAAQAVVAGDCPPGMRCAVDYPADGDRIAAQLFLERCAAGVDPRPFGAFLVCLGEANETQPPLVIGGIGYHGGVDERGRVEIGYGIVPSYQRSGHATKALGLLVAHARSLGVVTLLAETDHGNTASQIVLQRHGFVRSGSDEETVFFACPLIEG